MNSFFSRCNQNKNYKNYTLKCAIVDDECNICLGEYLSGQKIIVLSCGHKYHQNCLHKWFQRKKICPICKIDIQI